KGGFDFWESGMDVRLGKDLYESFTRYQARVIRALDNMAERYQFETIDASRTPDKIFLELKKRITRLLKPRKKKPSRARQRAPKKPPAEAPVAAEAPLTEEEVPVPA